MSHLKKSIYAIAGIYYVAVPLCYLLVTWWIEIDTMAFNGTILVTGGAGYVGSHTVVELLNKSENDKPESLKRVEQITGKRVTFYNVDISDRNALNKIFKLHNIDCVIHFAALKAVGESVQIPLTYYQNNIAGSSTLFQVMQEHGVKKLVFSSSATVYGIPQFLPITEEHPTGQGCTNPYGKTKYFVEEILKDVCVSDPEWKVTLLRYFNPVGAHSSGLIGEDPSGIPNNLMPYVAQVAVGRRDKVHVFGSDYETPDGTGVRDYIHITDLAVGHVRALSKMNETSFKGWKAYNLGTGRGYSVLEVITAFSKASGRDINYQIDARREGDVAASYSDANKAKKELLWTADKDINDMCVDSWKWQLENPNGFQK